MRATMQQQGLSAEQRAEIQARVREATERAREAQQRAIEATQRADEAQAAQGGRLVIPPPPADVQVQGGRVVVDEGGQRIVIGPEEPVAVGGRGEPGMPPGFDIPPRAESVAYAFFLTIAVIAIGVPLVRAFARWLDRRGTPPAVPVEVTRRLEAIEQAVETVAVEVERISEGQRFTSRLLNDMREAPRLEAAERVAEPRR